jgi:hypothetical protein
MNRVLEHEPSLLEVAQICATCELVTAPLPSPELLPSPPDPLSALPLPSSEPVPLPLLVGADVPVPIDVLTDDDAAASLSVPMPASEDAAPVPLADAPLASPTLFAEALPSANESALAEPAAGSYAACASASMCELADAEPAPDEVAETSTLAEDEALDVPSSLVAELAPLADPLAVMLPPPVVTTSASASAAEAESAELGPAVPTLALESVVAVAKAWPKAKPSPVDVPFTSACAVAPSSVVESAVAEPDAVAPAPAVLSSTVASADPAPNAASLVPVADEVSVTSPVVGSVDPVAEAPVDTLESAELPSVPALCAEALPFAEADAPAPEALAEDDESECAAPPPAVAWLSDDALADAARAPVDFSHPL